MNTKIEYVKVDVINNLAKELLSTLDSVEGDLDIALYQRKSFNFRDIIDSTFPTVLVIDYEDIRKELTKYTDISTSIEEDIAPGVKVPTNAKRLTSLQVSTIVSAVRQGVTKAVGSAPTVSDKTLYSDISKIFDTVEAGQVLSTFKRKYPGVYKIQSTNVGKDIYLFPNFNIVGSRINDNINDSLDLLQELGHDAGSTKSIGQVLAYGHTSVGYKDSENNLTLQFNTPKLMGLIIDSINRSSNKDQLNIGSIDTFVTNSRQVDTYVEVSKDFSDEFASVFIKLGGNVVRFENTIINSLRGTVLEKTGNVATNKQLLASLSKSFYALSNKYADRIARNINRVLIAKGSPSLLEYIVHSIQDTIAGKTTKPFKGLDKLKGKSTGKTTVKTTSSTKATSKSKPAKLQKPIVKPNNVVPKSNLSSLQALLDKHLQDVVSANMGNGGERRVLNYRTGRLAASAKVERLTQSREGMITAFYTYMKNPYATFSDGGRQQYPKTRDPKLLISGAIREIAATQAITRLRSVLI